MPLLPATGSEMAMGRVRQAYTNTAPAANANISLNATLGPFKGVAAGAQISLSSVFGGATTPFTY